MICIEKNLPLLQGQRIPILHRGLEGELRAPAGADSLVICAHGSACGRKSPQNQLFAQALREAGLATLSFDLLTPEEEAVDQITRQFRFNIPLLAERLVRATRWVKKQPGAERLRLGYLGSSTGGAAALVAAAQFGDDVSAVVSPGGRSDLAGERLSDVQSPTLLIVGELDDFVLDLNKQAFQKLRCEKELQVVVGATHQFVETGTFETVERLTTDWFKRHLKDASGESALQHAHISRS